MQTRCEEITGDKFIGALWGPGGESMRAVLTVGGVRVPINPALKTLDHAIKELANQRAQELVKEHVQESLEKVEEVLDHAASQLKERFGGPDAEWEEAMEAEAADPAPAIPQGHHKCLKCDTIYNAEEQKECPKCKHPRPTWYEFNEESES
jgi:rubrerythrin